MLSYVVQSEECRSVVIERYFGDVDAKPCGVCDVCLSRRRRERASEAQDERLLQLIAEGAMSVKEVVAAIGGNAEAIVERIDKMVRLGKISISVDGKLKINE
jgi:ATP-dependent DNA helicase RecQ